MASKFTPNLVDIMTLGRMEYTFTIPGREQFHQVKIGLLDDGENEQALKAVTATDFSTRQHLLRKEILVLAIMSIDNVDYNDIDRKPELRDILNKCTPPQVTYLFSQYEELRILQDAQVEERIKSIPTLSDVPVEDTTAAPEQPVEKTDASSANKSQ